MFFIIIIKYFNYNHFQLYKVIIAILFKFLTIKYYVYTCLSNLVSWIVL